MAVALGACPSDGVAAAYPVGREIADARVGPLSEAENAIGTRLARPILYPKLKQRPSQGRF